MTLNDLDLWVFRIHTENNYLTLYSMAYSVIVDVPSRAVMQIYEKPDK